MKNSKKQIFVLFSCNTWKTYDSMRLVGATTSPTKLKMMIIEEIKDGNMAYKDEEASINQQVTQFKKDFKEKIRGEINSLLTYGFIDYMYDGER